MKHLIKRKAALLSAVLIALLLAGCTAGPAGDKESIQEELLAKLPDMDTSAFNRFLFSMDIIAGNTDNDGKELAMSGAVETYSDISHMYNLDVHLVEEGRDISAETWADFGAGDRYTNTGEGFILDKVANRYAINDLADVINNRDTEMVLATDRSTCTLSWVFPTDDKYLFGSLLSHYTTDMELEGYGRITAVFDPDTRAFQYFTVVISTNNEERAGALLDAIFYWEVINSQEDALKIPDEISCTAYETSTGVSTNGGYDEVVNPMAEAFIEAYGGKAEVTHYDTGSALFWTLSKDGVSATVNYVRSDGATAFYEDSRDFLTTFYGEPAEETEGGAYFYDPSIAELTYIAKGEGWCGEIIITGAPDMTQGELRKPLITYKSRLGI